MHDAREFAWTKPFRNAVCVGWDCSRGIKRTVQVLAAHCSLKQSSDIVASPGMLAPALSTDREQQQQHILTPALAKDPLAQHHAHHCSVCGAERHTHRATHAHTRTHAYACTCCARDGLRYFFSIASDAPTLVFFFRKAGPV